MNVIKVEFMIELEGCEKFLRDAAGAVIKADVHEFKQLMKHVDNVWNIKFTGHTKKRR